MKDATSFLRGDVLEEQRSRYEDFGREVEAAIERADAAGNEVFQKMEARAQQFGGIFVSNLIQAGEGGFKEFARLWAMTLTQMAAQSLATDLFGSLFRGIGKAAGGGGFFGSLASGAKGLLGFAQGGQFAVPAGPRMFSGVDSQLVAFRAKPGEMVSVGGGGGIVVNSTLNVTGGGNPRDLNRAMELRDRALIAKMKDELRRGR